VHLLNIVKAFRLDRAKPIDANPQTVSRSFCVATPIIVSQVPGGACKTAGFFTTSPTSAQVGTRGINTTRRFVFASEKLPFRSRPPFVGFLRALQTSTA
jgi:hypothetical protein